MSKKRLILKKAEYIKIAEMTDCNFHTGALIEIAKHFRFKHFEKCLKHINEIHKILQHMPYALGQYRYSIMNEMLESIKNNYDQETLEKINKCL